MVCWCGRGETKNVRSTNRHQNQQVQKLDNGGEKGEGLSRNMYKGHIDKAKVD